MATETISQDLADLLVTKNFDPKYTDEKGMDAAPGEAVTFAFDWVAPSGKNYGTAVAVLGDGNDLQFFFGDNLGRSMENPEDKEAWFAFLEQMSDFSTQHKYTWSPKDINQLKHTMAGMAAIKEGLFEGYYGTRRVSYMGEQTSARLVIKHNRMLGENDKRYRYVESLYIETADGERFKLPFTKLAGGRAMLEHVRQGGKPYDIRGNHIAEMVTEMNLLARFNRASQSRVFEGHTQELVESAQNYYHTLQENLKHLSNSRGYRAYFESWSPADIGSESALVEDIKTLFVEQTLDARIESALPLLAKIQQQGTAMKEVQVFETWVNRMAEGTWALPDTPEQEARLQELMSSELIAGPDGTNATEQLYDLVGDDELFDLIGAAAAADPNSNIWDNAEIVSRLGELGVDTSAITQRGAEQEPEQEVTEDLGGGEYGRVLDALQLYYPRLSMGELNVPGYHKVIANKANVPVEYAAQVINDFVHANDPDEDEFDDFEDEQDMSEMDKSQPSHGRDGHVSHSTYGSRDRGGSTGPERTGKMTTADRMMRDAEKAFLKHMSSAEKVDKGHRNPNIDEGDLTRTPTGLVHRATDKYGAGEEPFNPHNPGKYARDLDSVNKQQVKDLDASMGINWKNRGSKGIEIDEVSDQTLYSYLTKIDADSQKHKMDPTKRSPEKANRSVAGFSRAFNKLDARKEKTNEGHMAEVDGIIQSIIAGDIDPYDIMAHPAGPEEQYVAKILEKEYEDVAIDHGLHPDDDFEQILDRVVDRLAHDYGHPMDEADTVNSFAETTVAGSVAPMSAELEEAQWGQAPQDPMNYNGAITGSYYEDNEIVKNAKKLTDGWKGSLAGSAAGSVAGDIAGSALGPAAGAAIGGAIGGVPGAIAGGTLGAVAGGPVGATLGGLAGAKIGDKLGGPEETDEAKTSDIVKGAVKASTQGLGDIFGGPKPKDLLTPVSEDPLARLKTLALSK